jgi:hypothetical protein
VEEVVASSGTSLEVSTKKISVKVAQGHHKCMANFTSRSCSFNLLTASHERYQNLAFGFSPKSVSIPFTYPFVCGANAHSDLGRLIVRVSRSHAITHRQTITVGLL